MNKKLQAMKTISIWTLISLVLQLGFYTAFNRSIADVMNPAAPQGPAPAQTAVTGVLPDAEPENIQVSYSCSYLAYTADGVLKVYDIKQGRIVFEKEPPADGGGHSGFLSYQWLSDRNSLIYFCARKNADQKPAAAVKTPAAHEDVFEAEDPNAAKEDGSAPAKQTEPANPQITELNTLDLADGSDAAPDDRRGIDLENFPAGGQILQIASSTYTNLIYVTVKTGKTVRLMEIDIMKNSRFLQVQGDTVANMAASDRYGTLYAEAGSGGGRQILALNGTQSKTISKDGDSRLLGVRDGRLYVGEVNGGRLVKVLSGPESSDIKNGVELTPCWEGDIPFEGKRVLIGSKGQVLVYDSQGAEKIQGGQNTAVSFDGGEAFLSGDGEQLLRLSSDGGQAEITLEPLSGSWDRTE